MPATCFLPTTPFAPAAAASTSTAKTSDTLVLTGIISAPAFYKARSILQTIAAQCPHLKTTILPLPETAFTTRRNALRARYPALHPSTHTHFLIELHTSTTTLTQGPNKLKHVTEKTTDTLLTRAELIAYAHAKGVDVPDDAFGTQEEEDGVHGVADEASVKLAAEEYAAYLSRLPGPVVSIEFWHTPLVLPLQPAGNGNTSVRGSTSNDVTTKAAAAEKQPLGPQVLIELFGDSCPKTVKHFLQFVREGGAGHTADSSGTAVAAATPAAAAGGHNYKNSFVSRIVKGGWMECGDENFIHPHEAYTLSYVTSSKGPHTATTPFLITLAPMPAFNKRYVAFGRVLQGLDTLNTINNVRTSHERPESQVWIQEIKLWDNAGVDAGKK
ncbi:putative inactive peptidyl-prolyl cis-trans isomerase-like 6 [Geranomyces michiganensis]|nr:putative inactive peptidyl-prolyl cis-trans isomerase-like 6 [Geranomyces michiganensis]